MSRCWAAIGLCVLLGGCGLNVASADLFQLTRAGQGPKLSLIVNDAGTIRCDGGPPKPISDPLLLRARGLVTALDADAKGALRLPAAAGSAYLYTMRFQDGTISFADTSAAVHRELAEAEVFAQRAIRGPCRMGQQDRSQPQG